MTMTDRSKFPRCENVSHSNTNRLRRFFDPGWSNQNPTPSQVDDAGQGTLSS